MNKQIEVKSAGIDFAHTYDSVVPDNLDARHCHDKYEIIMVLEGEGKYIVEGEQYRICPRTLMVMRPFEYHCVELDKNQPYERCVVHFSISSISPDVVKMLDVFNNTGENVSGNFYPPQAISGNIEAIFERYELALSLPPEEREVYLKLLTSELILMLSVATGEKMSHDDEDIGTKVLRYINDHLEKDVSLDKLARRFFVSKYYLCRAFKKRNGVSIHGYIVHKRVMHAKHLIDFGETASGAAYKVGFGDYSAFYRAYVKIIGKSPTSNEGGAKNGI